MYSNETPYFNVMSLLDSATFQRVFFKRYNRFKSVFCLFQMQPNFSASTFNAFF